MSLQTDMTDSFRDREINVFLSSLSVFIYSCIASHVLSRLCAWCMLQSYSMNKPFLFEYPFRYTYSKILMQLNNIILGTCALIRACDCLLETPPSLMIAKSNPPTRLFTPTKSIDYSPHRKYISIMTQ